MFSFTNGKPLPDGGLFGVYRTFKQVKLQQTAFCHNRCCFCPLPLDHSWHKGIMDISSLEHVLRALPDFSGHVELATDGESLLLDDLPERCALIKKYWPHSHLGVISTLNIDRGPDYIKSLFANGLEILHVSCYGHTPEDYKKIHGSDGLDALCRNISYMREVPDLKNKKLLLIGVYNAEKELGISNAEEKQLKFQRFAAAVGFKFVTTRLHSWQGRVSFGLQEKRHPLYPCSVVWGGWADILHVRWNLEIVPCCAFNGSEYSFGNLHKNSLQEIFTSSRFIEFYTKHWLGREYDLPVCSTCTNYRSISTPGELARFAAWQATSLTGQKVWFWGAGEAYRRYKTYFGLTKPQGIILDIDHPTSKIDDITVFHPEEALVCKEQLPIIIFAYDKNSSTILRTIALKYPNYHGRIILCPADYLHERDV